uniref:Uncharacterized protein n=1 Tax=viral metagenome TaxID=1070528 RepID=A0A6M3KMY6_9ZZZZ
MAKIEKLEKLENAIILGNDPYDIYMAIFTALKVIAEKLDDLVNLQKKNKQIESIYIIPSVEVDKNSGEEK